MRKGRDERETREKLEEPVPRDVFSTGPEVLQAQCDPGVGQDIRRSKLKVPPSQA